MYSDVYVSKVKLIPPPPPPKINDCYSSHKSSMLNPTDNVNNNKRIRIPSSEDDHHSSTSCRTPKNRRKSRLHDLPISPVPPSILKGTSSRMRSIYCRQAEVNTKRKRRDESDHSQGVSFSAETIRLYDETGYGKYKSKLRERRLTKWKFLN